MVSKIKAGIVGGAGYTGGELLRLLLNHPQTDIVFINSASNAGNAVSKIHADLIGETDLLFTADLSNEIDVLFLCVGHGDAAKFLAANHIDDKIKVGIVGGAGYTGGELLRLLLNHPHAEIAFINSGSNAGNPVSKIHADLIGETDLLFTAEL
ncbi:MAG: hypothetical protein H7320_19825, partial [Ferruginibacter sp.]|nr:hypothetical protein [Ferruginibacter sp.]